MMMGVVEQNSTPVIALCCWEHAYWEEHNGELDGTYMVKEIGLLSRFGGAKLLVALALVGRN